MMKYIVLAAATVSLAVPSFAQQGGTPLTPEQREARFVAADKNKDNKLDKVEWTSTLPEQMAANAEQIWSARIDADGDGFITKEQYLALRMGPRPPQ